MKQSKEENYFSTPNAKLVVNSAQSAKWQRVGGNALDLDFFFFITKEWSLDKLKNSQSLYPCLVSKLIFI